MSVPAMKQARDFISRLKFADAEPEPEIVMAVLDQAIAEAEKQEPWKWFPAPVKTEWGHEMVVADLGIDKDHTVSIYCEREQTAKVESMFATHPPKREWRGLTDEELEELRRSDDLFEDAPMWSLIARAIEAKLKEKNT